MAQAPFMLALTTLLALASVPQAATLTLTVSNIPEAGELNLGIFETPEGFEAKDVGKNDARPGLVQGARQPVQAGKSRLEFELPEGVYAIKLFLDLNGNQKVDTNFLGIPKEPFGFSNNAKARLGPPSFEAAAFPVKGPTEISVELQ